MFKIHSNQLKGPLMIHEYRMLLFRNMTSLDLGLRLLLLYSPEI